MRMRGIMSLVLILILAGFTACKDYKVDEEKSETLEESANMTVSDYKQSSPANLVNIRMAGDIMFHDLQLEAGYDSRRGSYDFYSSFSAIRDQLLVSDYVFANLETTFSGPPYSGYPRFSTPDSGAEALAASGIDFLTTANNHSLDYGLKGASRTLEVLDTAGLSHTGTYDDDHTREFKSQDKESSVHMLDIKGLSIAVINYTYGLNNYDSNPYKNHINSIDFYDQEALEVLYGEVERAEDSKADYVMVFLHFGREFQVIPDEEQEDLAYELIDLGADIIIGSHPHRIQPIEVVWSLKGEILEDPKIIAYSLGDFLSSTDTQDLGRENETQGMLFSINFKETDSGAWSLKGLGILPTTCLWQGGQRIIMAIDQDSQQYINTIEHLTARLEERTLVQVSVDDGWYEIEFQ